MNDFTGTALLAQPLLTVSSNMATDYGQRTPFLIPEYAAYRERGDALLRHQWDYLASMMPFSLPAKYTYDYLPITSKVTLRMVHSGTL